MIKRNSLPHAVEATPNHPKHTTTTNRTFASTSTVTLKNIQFPEFGNHRLDNIKANVFGFPYQWLLDFCKLNELIVQKPFPLPRIQDILHQGGKYNYFTKIDLSMTFYYFELFKHSKKICIISTEENNYSYN